MKKGSKLSAARTEFLLDLAEFFATKVGECGVEEERAIRLGLAFADEFADRWKGQHFYVPKNEALRTSIRHEFVRSRFTGNNHQELAELVGCGVRNIYKILDQSSLSHS
jgi:Mor family transcriptional regulator